MTITVAGEAYAVTRTGKAYLLPKWQFKIKK